LIQILILLAVAWLTVARPPSGGAWLAAGPLSRFDPLIGLSAVLASREFIAFWSAALLTIALTVALGRAWCGWICPLGTVLDVIPLPWKQMRAHSRRWRLGKYITLAVVLGAALAGNLSPMILDPTTIITRPLQELVRPLLGSDAVGQSIGASLGWGAVHAVAFLSLLPLVAVLTLNVFERRFWCHSLCPLGGLLALVSMVPGVRRRVQADTCTSCARCVKACPGNAIQPIPTTDEAAGFPSSPAECITCRSCVDACKTGSNTFGYSSQPSRGYEQSRRDAVIAAGATGFSLTAAFLPFGRQDDYILRPPSTSDKRLAQLCVRCGACYGACPTGVLRPSVSFTSEAGPWTPMLDERPVHCTLECNRCAKLCPTDALHTLTLDESVHLGLGVKAEVDRARCRAWARNRACMRCLTLCPIAGALTGGERPPGLPGRGSTQVQVPYVDPELCVGCNQCAVACVMEPPAIGVPFAPQSDSYPEYM
jgi:ferredoxin